MVRENERASCCLGFGPLSAEGASPRETARKPQVCISAHFSLLFVGPEDLPSSGYSLANPSISRGSST